MSYLMVSNTNNVVISQSSTAPFPVNKPGSEWLASIETVTQTQLFNEVGALLEHIWDAICLAGYTPRFLTMRAADTPKVCEVCGSIYEVKSLCSACR